METTVNKILKERGARYGDFEVNGRISQTLKLVMRNEPNWPLLPYEMREALEMISHKTARILNGDPHYKDNWNDIAGYAQLIAQELED